MQTLRSLFAVALIGSAMLTAACDGDGTPVPTVTPQAKTPTPSATPTALPDPTATPTISRPDGEFVLFLNGDPVTSRTLAFPETLVTASAAPIAPDVSYPAGARVTLAYQSSIEGVGWGGDAIACAGQATCTVTMDADKHVSLGSDGLPVFLSNLELQGVQTLSREPSQIQFTFSLRDQDDNAVVVPREEIAARTHISERPQGATDWQQIDYSETSFFVHTAENFALDVVFVLDFTNSVAQARLANGQTGTDAVLAAFETAIAELPEAHRIGVVEFHDRSFAPSVLSELTTDRDSLRQTVRNFVASAYDAGSSRVWDAIDVALDQFSDSDRTIRTIVFLSDGRDTSSSTSASQVASKAAAADVLLYPLGVGDIGNVTNLTTMASQTGGAYYEAPGFDDLSDLLEQITADLAGQYRVSYNTLRTEGRYEVKIDVEIGPATGSFVSPALDLGGIFGPDNVGQLVTDPPADSVNGQTTVFVRALHVPRNVTHLKLRLLTDRRTTAELVAGEDGGLIADWALEGPDSEGWITARGGEPIAFGNFGLLLKMTVDGALAGADVSLEIDNSGYDGQKSFNDTTIVGVVGSCNQLAEVLRSHSILPSLVVEAQAAVNIGIDSHCVGILQTVLESGILTPTATPTPTPVPSNQWIASGDLSLQRANPALARLADGSVMVIGGRFINDEAVTSVDVYNAETNGWSTVAPLTTERESATATTLVDGRVLVVGGRATATADALVSAETYEPLTGRWTDTSVGGATGRPAEARLGHTATLLADGRVLIVGGQLGSGAEWTAEVFDPTFSEFVEVESLDFARQDHAAVLMPNGTVWIFGSARADVRVIERFDPETNSFSRAGTLRESYTALTATLLPDGSVLVLGTSPTTSVQAEIVSPDGSSRLLSASGVLNGTIAVFRTPGGDFLYVGANTSLGPAVLEDSASVTATKADGTPIDKATAAAFQLGSGEILLVGDLDSNTAWRFVY